ncbi:unnamed protein product [Calicophoron daubneyi]|uniref:Sperm-tail PG-rich repeat-containing protein 2 n=1 Tax=Calicophoron daubneyi TaxID=300641 RepID=A0AAV2TSM7_CALDB
MYDRQKRIFTFQKKGGTDRRVGPGSYSPSDICCQRFEIGYAPFDSLGERKFTFTFPDADKFPAPCDYKPELLTPRIKGCSTLRNESPRFPAFKSFGPGPDAYAVTSEWAGKKPGPCGLLAPQAILRQILGEGDLAKKCSNYDRVAFVRFRDVPSIPSGNFVHGYEEGPDGRLRPQKGPYRDLTIGPAYYGPTNIPTFTKYRGCAWSKHTSKRPPLCSFAHQVGPDQYDPYGDPWEKLAVTARERNNIQNLHILNVPRFIEKVYQQTKKENLPGPNAYKIPDDPYKSCKRIGHNAAPFNAEEQRFKDSQFKVPAPNTYLVKVGSLKLQPIGRNDKRPFDSTANRFRRKQTDAPAPNRYKPLDGFLDELERKPTWRPDGGKLIGFGSSVVRNAGRQRTLSEGETVPGPAHYNPEQFEELSTMHKVAPTIAGRGREKSSPRPVAPAPGTYDVAASYEASQTKHRPATPMTAEGRERQGAFLVSAERFGKRSCLGPREPDLPGPSDYCVPSTLNEKSGKFVFQSERFPEKKIESTPGPADYKLSTAVESSLRLDTFNVTYPGKVNVAPMALRRP